MNKERELRAALMEFVRVEHNFGHAGQHKDEECADCKRVRMAHAALGHGFLTTLETDASASIPPAQIKPTP